MFRPLYQQSSTLQACVLQALNYFKEYQKSQPDEVIPSLLSLMLILAYHVARAAQTADVQSCLGGNGASWLHAFSACFKYVVL